MNSNNPEFFVYTVSDSLAQFSLFLNLLFIGGKLCSLTYLYHQTHSMFSLILQRAKQWDRETWASIRQLHCFPCLIKGWKRIPLHIIEESWEKNQTLKKKPMYILISFNVQIVNFWYTCHDMQIKYLASCIAIWYNMFIHVYITPTDTYIFVPIALLLLIRQVLTMWQGSFKEIHRYL